MNIQLWFSFFTKPDQFDCVEKKIIGFLNCEYVFVTDIVHDFALLPEFRFVDSKSADILDFLEDCANFIRQERDVFDIRMRWVLKLKT